MRVWILIGFLAFYFSAFSQKLEYALFKKEKIFILQSRPKDWGASVVKAVNKNNPQKPVITLIPYYSSINWPNCWSLDDSTNVVMLIISARKVEATFSMQRFNLEPKDSIAQAKEDSLAISKINPRDTLSGSLS
jgi:hypothetical protein